MFNLIVFGPPGSGKGTQSQIIAKKHGFLHLSTGDLFRKEMQQQTAMGQLAAKFIDRGMLVPDNIVMRELYRFALHHQDAPGIVFDGFPRTIEQAIVLDKVFHKKELKITLVIAMLVPEQELIHRVMERSKDSNRSDDNLHIIQKRLEVYRQQTHPVIDYYKTSKRLVEVNGSRPISIVSSDIDAVVTKAIQKCRR
jgi:adenylate kinase